MQTARILIRMCGLLLAVKWVLIQRRMVRRREWEWAPNANPSMHLAMVLSKNESSEEEI
jgi:hypothetical protein